MFLSSFPFSLLISLSMTFTAALLTPMDNRLLWGIGVALAACISLYACFKVRWHQKALLLSNRMHTAFSAVLALCAALVLADGSILPAAGMLPALFCYAGAFANGFGKAAARLRSRMTKADCCFLWLSGCIGAVMIALIFSSTNAFYAANVGLMEESFDVIYTSDSAQLLEEDVFCQLNAKQNDIRQPLFALFALPFAAPAKVLSQLLFFIPNVYPVLMACIQFWLLMTALVMIRHMLPGAQPHPALFYGACVLLYPVLLFSLMMEQYMFAVFWLIALGSAHMHAEDDRMPLLMASAGSLLTSAVGFVLVPKEARLKTILLDACKAVFLFLTLMILFGRFQVLATSVSMVRWLLMRFSSGPAVISGESWITWPEKLMQFSHFVQSCFVAPSTYIHTGLGYPAFQLAPVTSYNLWGILLLALCGLGFVLNWKQRYAWLCALWVGFSFFLLGLMGWGVQENGLTLYTLYFFWAYASLLFLLVNKLFSRWKAVRNVVWGLMIAVLAAMNLPSIWQMIAFGLAHYPA